MIDPADHLVTYLHRLADSATPRPDLEGVKRGLSSYDHAIERLPTPPHGRTAGRAAAAVLLVAGVGAIAAVSIARDDSSSRSHRSSPSSDGVGASPSRPSDSVSSTTRSGVETSASATIPDTRPSDTATPATPTPALGSGTLLGGRETTLGPDEWIVAATLPPGFHHQWALHQSSTQKVMYADGAGHTLDVNSVTGDSVGSISGTTTVIGDATWTMTHTGAADLAFRAVGDSFVSVSSNNGGLTADELVATIEALTIVSTAELPTAVISPTAENMIDVTSFDAGTDTLRMAADEVDGNFCTSITSVGSRATSCVQSLDVQGIMSSVSSGSTEHSAGSTVVTVEASGIVRSDVATVDVELADGRHISVEPADVSGRFDVRFWVIRATLETTSDLGNEADPAIISATARDAAGNVLAVSPLSSIAQPDSPD